MIREMTGFARLEARVLSGLVSLCGRARNSRFGAGLTTGGGGGEGLGWWGL